MNNCTETHKCNVYCNAKVFGKARIYENVNFYKNIEKDVNKRSIDTSKIGTFSSVRDFSFFENNNFDLLDLGFLSTLLLF